MLALRNSGSAEESFKEHALVLFRLLVVGIHDRERFARHLLQVGATQHERSGNSSADSEFCWRCSGLSGTFLYRGK